MGENDSLEQLSTWLTENWQQIKIPAQVTVRAKTRAYGERTTVKIDHRLSCPLQGYDGWRIGTKKTFLPLAQFNSWARQKVNTAASHGTGRTIYCYDDGLDDQVVAALSYHIHDRADWPLFITAIAFRIDFKEDRGLRARTVAGAFLLKQYAHALGELIGRGPAVHMDMAVDNLEGYAVELGFRRAPALKGLRVAGTHMLQDSLK